MRTSSWTRPQTEEARTAIQPDNTSFFVLSPIFFLQSHQLRNKGICGLPRRQRDKTVPRAILAVRKVLGAISAVAEYQNRNWNVHQLIRIDEFDRRIGGTPWAVLQAQHGPLPQWQFAAYVAALPAPPPGSPPRSLDGPSRRELVDAVADRELSWENDYAVYFWNLNDEEPEADHRRNKPWHERVLPNQVLLEIIPTLGDGQCFWYSIAQAL